jgi:hypothetical protein
MVRLLAVNAGTDALKRISRINAIFFPSFFQINLQSSMTMGMKMNEAVEQYCLMHSTPINSDLLALHEETRVPAVSFSDESILFFERQSFQMLIKW